MGNCCAAGDSGALDSKSGSMKLRAYEDQHNPFDRIKGPLKVGKKTYQMYKLQALKDKRYQKLPFSIRVLLESAIRNCDDFNIKRKLHYVS